MDFPRAWQLANASGDSEHNPRCSFIVGERGLLCDCEFLTGHPEYLQETTLDGKPIEDSFWADLNRRMQDPKFREGYVEESLRIQEVDARANGGEPVGEAAP